MEGSRNSESLASLHKLYLKYLLPCRPTQSRSSCTLVEFALCLMAACTDLAANPRLLDPSSPAVKIATTLHNMLPKRKGGGLGETRCRQSIVTLNLVISFGGSTLAFVALRHMCPQIKCFVCGAGWRLPVQFTSVCERL